MLGRVVILGLLIVLLYRWITGRWPWQARVSTREQAIIRARRLLGVEPRASRDDIIAAHRKLIAMVHPDRGGSNEQVHEANAARDILFDELPGGPEHGQEQ